MANPTNYNTTNPNATGYGEQSASDSFLLLENSDFRLLENSDKRLLESGQLKPTNYTKDSFNATNYS